MPGPPPKPRATRQRRNKTPFSTLPAAGPGIKAPPLPDRACPCGDGCDACEDTGVQPWHPLVLAWWMDIWASPMASEFLRSDTHGLFVLAELRDQFWRQPDKELAGEIRLQEQRFGLSSLDRRRLQWEVERVEQTQKRRPPNEKPKGKVSDPLRFLKAVK